MMKYATVDNQEDSRYRNIASIVTDIGFPMNHSSARNYVLKVMQKLADALGAPDHVVKTAQFHDAMGEVFDILEARRRTT